MYANVSPRVPTLYKIGESGTQSTPRVDVGRFTQATTEYFNATQHVLRDMPQQLGLRLFIPFLKEQIALYFSLVGLSVRTISFYKTCQTFKKLSPFHILDLNHLLAKLIIV